MFVDLDDMFVVGLFSLCNVMCILFLDLEYVFEVDGEEGLSIWELYFWSY